MEKVLEEWEEAHRKVGVNYDRNIYDMIASPDNREFLGILRKYVRRGCIVLEAGCGYGHKCIYFSRYLEASVIGIDFVIEPLKNLNSYLKTTSNLQVLTVAGDVTKLPFREKVFDVVTSFGVIEHFRKDLEAVQCLNEASRVLKNGGILLLTIPNFAATIRNKLVIALTKGRFGMYHKPWTRLRLASMLKNSRSLRIVEADFLPFGFRSLILSVVKSHSLEKALYFLYHAIWRALNSIVKIIGGDYQNPIYIVAKKTE